ncbi:MAG: type I restriction enzyme HsdR N-terminal domain-containing protein [Desulfobacterales bacterium]|nr:type I restriction enzyme HsdR N-terminal domain-containing protein [Desulfobacterales bacterium]MBF0396593.1 type I restriction enzyme HsdR N-terminal domain-containing protein [Desulfobacterales bacterium]
MAGHHLILGKLTDYLTGEIVDDTLDERYHQKIARMLIEEKGYLKQEIVSRIRLMVQTSDKKATVPVNFKINLNDKTKMIIKFGPGSLVTRERSLLGISRLLEAYQIPITVITNGEDAHILNAETGKLIGSSLQSIPSKYELEYLTSSAGFQVISKKRIEIESRIVYAYEVDDICPCDDTICRL